MSKKILVTGGAGFIGSHIADAYLQAGDTVWIVDDLSSGKPANVPEGARFVRMDIRDPALDGVFREAGGFDVISHHAAQIDVRVSVTDPRRDAAINVDGFLNVAECARATAAAASSSCRQAASSTASRSCGRRRRRSRSGRSRRTA
jgi:UDP-glucose 4-epimerase